MNENEMKMHEELWNAYMDLGYGVVESMIAATADIRAMQRITRLDFADAGIFGI